jgi:pimeloyl-ACP methyl ester carboxylesterase
MDRLVASGKAEQAGERFCRSTLGTTAWNLLPDAARRDMRKRGQQIRDDLHANAAFRMSDRELGAISVPVLLLEGGRSRKAFERKLDSLHRALPRSERKVLARAEHVPYGEAWREFADALTDFIQA